MRLIAAMARAFCAMTRLAKVVEDALLHFRRRTIHATCLVRNAQPCPHPLYAAQYVQDEQYRTIAGKASPLMSAIRSWSAPVSSGSVSRSIVIFAINVTFKTPWLI